MDDRMQYVSHSLSENHTASRVLKDLALFEALQNAIGKANTA
jgi:hypothetical protein